MRTYGGFPDNRGQIRGPARWKRLQEARFSMKSQVGWEVGTGDISFWEDDWTPLATATGTDWKGFNHYFF